MANIYALVDTWNDAGTTFTGIGLNVTDTASASGSLLMDLQVGGASKFSVRKDGTFSVTIGNSSAPTFRLANDDDSGLNLSTTYTEFVYSGATRGIAGVDDGAAMFKLPDSGFFGWSPNATVPSTSDLRLYRDAAGTLAQRNSTNAQTFNLYNTYTDASNYERGFMKWNSNVLEIGTEAAGTGSNRNLNISVQGRTYSFSSIGIGLSGGSSLYHTVTATSGGQAAIGSGSGIGFVGNINAHPFQIRTNNQNRLVLDTNGSVQIATALTVATLPGTPVVGMMARVTDASAPAVGLTVTGGGAANALCWYNGTNWTVIGV